MRDADSLALDPHKWMSVPVEAVLALVRNGATMREAFSLVPAYVRTDGNSDRILGPPWFSEYGFQQTESRRQNDATAIVSGGAADAECQG